MRRMMRRGERGYVLAEALVGGVVMMLAVAGVLGAVSQAQEHIGRSVADQTAAQVIVEQLERLRALPASSTAWNVAATACPTAALPQGWVCTVTVTAVEDNDVTAPVTPPLRYKRAVVRVDYRGTSLSMETLRW